MNSVTKGAKPGWVETLVKSTVKLNWSPSSTSWAVTGRAVVGPASASRPSKVARASALRAIGRSMRPLRTSRFQSPPAAREPVSLLEAPTSAPVRSASSFTSFWPAVPAPMSQP
ncbi:hypothetical protein D9M71_48500 [compost metagenome]